MASPTFEGWVIPVACVILVGLFAIQSRGTEAVGRVFGPVMVVSFTTLGVLGLNQILQYPAVLEAINPMHIVELFQAEPKKGFLALGSIFLAVTGGEALYADMGHFGRRPITLVWYGIVLPGLVLNYFGQAALLITDPNAVESPFYRLAPEWGVVPLAILATMASVIASQALISGAFSLTVQAVQLDYLPRVKVQHTSKDHHGQVYVPLVNWALMIGCVGLVLGFRTSTNLAAAYGIAVTSTMVITSIIFFVVVRNRWGWSLPKTLLVVTPLLAVDTAFLVANIPKIPAGGWFPILVAAGLLVQMATWRRGRQLVAARIRRAERTVPGLLEESVDAVTVQGTAVFMFKDAGMAPPALVNNLRHNKVCTPPPSSCPSSPLTSPASSTLSAARPTSSTPGCTRSSCTSGSWRNQTSPRPCPVSRSTVPPSTRRRSPTSSVARQPSKATPRACTLCSSTSSCCSSAAPAAPPGSSSYHPSGSSRSAVTSRSDAAPSAAPPTRCGACDGPGQLGQGQSRAVRRRSVRPRWDGGVEHRDGSRTGCAGQPGFE